MAYIENLDELKEESKKIDVEQILNLLKPGIKIHRSGNDLRTCCPVHDGADGKENFAININTHEWFCHSHQCKGANLIDLYAQSRKMDFLKAAEEFASHFKLKIKYRDHKATNGEYTPESVLTCWNESKPQGNDNYFSKKKLTHPPIARFGKNPFGFNSTQVPYKDIEGKFKYILDISNKKRILKVDNDISGAFALLGEINPNGKIFIGEGIATVATAWEATKKEIPAVSCGSWSNILMVVTAIKGKYPNAKPIILIDCDDGGNGLKAAQIVANEFPDTTFRKPSFEAFPHPDAKDVNDIISKCGQSLDEVRTQLEIDFKLPTPTNTTTMGAERQPLNFYEKLGVIINDHNFSIQLKERTYGVFEREHKRLFSSGGLITGYEKIDDQLYFAKGDFVVVQALSNHGKSTFMLQMAYRFLIEKVNQSKDPMCIFITYESMPIRIEEKLINIIGHACENDIPIKYNIRSKEKYLYPSREGFPTTITTYNHIQKDNRIHILKNMPLENIEHLIDLYKSEYPGRTIILFLDYLQIIETNIETEGWQRIKGIAYGLESLAIKKEIIVISACQVNENRQTREGRDIYNAATTMIDIFNHSHVSLKNNRDLEKLYKPQVNGKNLCTFSAIKQKHGSSFDLPDYFLFNGYGFEVNESTEKENSQSKQQQKLGNNNKEKDQNPLMPQTRASR